VIRSANVIGSPVVWRAHASLHGSGRIAQRSLDELADDAAQHDGEARLDDLFVEPDRMLAISW